MTFGNCQLFEGQRSCWYCGLTYGASIFDTNDYEPNVVLGGGPCHLNIHVSEFPFALFDDKR